MKARIIVMLLAVLMCARQLAAQNDSSHTEILLYAGKPPGSEDWDWQEKSYFSKTFNVQLVYNVVQPTITVFKPDSVKSNGTAVVICPGGAFRLLSINSEGREVAAWLNKKGITCFVLRYRLVHSLNDDPAKDLAAGIEKNKFEQENAMLVPLAVADAGKAISYVREHAGEWGVLRHKVGILGFSAGGIVSGSLAMEHDTLTRPDFVGCIYAPLLPDKQAMPLPADAPPLFLAAAGDDGEHIIPGMLAFYNKWQAGQKPAELHLYPRGGHGFGMRVQHLPTDSWIDRFAEWMVQEGF